MLKSFLTESKALEFSHIEGWLNSQPLTMESLLGRAVLLDFWTFSCANCIHTLPHTRELHMKYSGDRFVVVGVHTPEYEFEKSPENVADAVKRFRIEYPVAIDSDNVTWRLFGNKYWPRQTLVDSRGIVRWEHAGEGDYDMIENEISAMLRRTGTTLNDR